MRALAYNTLKKTKNLNDRLILNSNETWTRAHDLALLLITVGYSSEQDLTDAEVDSVVKAIAGWRTNDSIDDIQEIVFEAVAVFQASDIDEEVARSIRSLKNSLSPAQRQRAMRDVVAVAEADGIIQDNERSLITVLGDIWEISPEQKSMLNELEMIAEEPPEWSVLHDIALVYILLSHGSDGILSQEELSAIRKRLGIWQPDLEPAQLEAILREAIQFYSTGPEKEDLADSTAAIKEHLTRSQRLAVVDDLVYIGEIDGPLTAYEADMVEQLTAIWEVGIRASRQDD